MYGSIAHGPLMGDTTYCVPPGAIQVSQKRYLPSPNRQTCASACGSLSARTRSFLQTQKHAYSRASYNAPRCCGLLPERLFQQSMRLCLQLKQRVFVEIKPKSQSSAASTLKRPLSACLCCTQQQSMPQAPGLIHEAAPQQLSLHNEEPIRHTSRIQRCKWSRLAAGLHRLFPRARRVNW